MRHCTSGMYTRWFFYFLSRNIYLFISLYIVPFKFIPSVIINLCQRFFQSSKHFWLARFGIVLSSSSNAVFISSIIANLYCFMGLFSFGNRKKSQGVKSGEYGGWGMITVLLLVTKLQRSNDMWAGALTMHIIPANYVICQILLLEKLLRAKKFPLIFKALPSLLRRYLLSKCMTGHQSMNSVLPVPIHTSGSFSRNAGPFVSDTTPDHVCCQLEMAWPLLLQSLQSPIINIC